MVATTGKYSAILFWITLVTIVIFNKVSWLCAFSLSLFVYLITGGWRFARLCYRTCIRDILALVVLARCVIPILILKRRGHGLRERFASVVKFRGRNATAMQCEDEQWTYGELDDYSNQIGNFLCERSIKKPENIALFMESYPKYIGTWLGAAKMGIATGLINSNLRQDALVHAIKQIVPQALVVGKSLTKAICEADIAGALPEADLILFGPKLGERKTSEKEKSKVSFLLLSDVLSKYPKISPPPPKEPPTLSDVLIYVFTSGTTGLPKAAIITFSRYTFMTSAIGHFTGIHSGDIIYTPLPLYHTAGGIIGAGQMLIHGVTQVIRPRFSVSEFWSDCIRYNITVVQYVGETCRYLLCQPFQKEETQHKVRLIVGNGLRREVWIDFVKRFNIPQVGEFYGATESNASVCNSNNKLGAMGFSSLIFPWVYPVNLVKTDYETCEVLRNPKTGLCYICEPGEVGQMIGRINRKNPMRNFDGYLDKNESIKKVIHNVHKNGDIYFLTGDLMVQDDEGYFYFVDRLGDTFRWRGENVSTTEVENVVAKAIDYVDCAVYGVEIPGNEGRAGMLCLATEITTFEDGNIQVEGVKFLKGVESEIKILNNLTITFAAQLPTYARPLFVRFSSRVNTTDTFKFRKLEVQREGFNPEVISDPIYYLDTKINVYKRLDKEVYARIIENKIKF